MPRAEGWVGGRRVGTDEEAVIMGGESRIGAVEAGVAMEPQRHSVDTVINEGASQDKLPRMTEKEFKDLHSRDGRISLAAEELLKRKIRKCGLDPEQEGVVRVLVGDKELKIGIGKDFGTILSEKKED